MRQIIHVLYLFQVVSLTDALAEALKRRTLGGSGVAWLPESSVTQELASGQLVRVGGRDWQARMTISLFCSPEKLDETGRMIWESFPEIT